jgi:hypothetical protein
MQTSLGILSYLRYFHRKNRKGGANRMAILNIKGFPDDLHRKAKAEAALMGISMKELIIRALTEYLKKKKGR